MEAETGILGRAYGRPTINRRIVAIGDSVTFGQHVDKEKRWTTLLAEHTGVEVVNKGVCGDTTRGGLERFPSDVQNLDPKVVLIQFGFNDCNHWRTDYGLPRVSLKAFRANLEEMVARVQKIGARPWLISMFLADKGADYQRWQVPYLNAIDTLRRELGMGSYGMFHGATIDTMDGLHPSEAGHAVYAERIAGLL